MKKPAAKAAPKAMKTMKKPAAVAQRVTKKPAVARVAKKPAVEHDDGKKDDDKKKDHVVKKSAAWARGLRLTDDPSLVEVSQLDSDGEEVMTASIQETDTVADMLRQLTHPGCCEKWTYEAQGIAVLVKRKSAAAEDDTKDDDRKQDDGMDDDGRKKDDDVDDSESSSSGIFSGNSDCTGASSSHWGRGAE